MSATVLPFKARSTYPVPSADDILLNRICEWWPHLDDLGKSVLRASLVAIIETGHARSPASSSEV